MKMWTLADLATCTPPFLAGSVPAALLDRWETVGNPIRRHPQ